MEKKRMDIKKLKKGSFVIIDDMVCQVEDVNVSSPSKHGGAKVRVKASGVFNTQSKNIVKPAGTKVSVPIMEKKTAQALSISGNRVQLMDMEDYSTFDAKIPDSLKDDIKEGEEVLVWKFGSDVLIKNTK